MAFEAAPTPREAAALHKYDKAQSLRSANIHRLWHKFCHRFKTKNCQAWKYDGWQLMQKVSRLEGKPGWEGLHVLSCDDSYHASSDIYLIEHRDGDYYWGTTVVVVTQCDGVPLKEFFLYGSHTDPLLTQLLKIQKKHHRSKESW